MFHGKPMYLRNVEKCLKIFDKVYVSSDDQEILDQAEKLGAVGILRERYLCGDTPNIPVYQHALSVMTDCDGIIAVQSNSPTIRPEVILEVKRNMEAGADEAMTIYPDGSIYGSVWGIAKAKLLFYGDPYHPNPTVRVIDNSVDIHTQTDFDLALREANHTMDI